MEIRGGKYLTFLLGEEVYGIPIAKAKEIVGVMEITPIPRAQGYIKGVTNLRGKIVPIVDLRAKFGMESAPYNERTCIIMIEVEVAGNKRLVGIAVDTVAEVLNIAKEDVELPPRQDLEIDGSFLGGLAKTKERVIVILDIDKILNSKEVVYLEKEFLKRGKKATG